MPRYELSIEEVVPYNHTVTIETEEGEDIDKLCDMIEKLNNYIAR